MRPVRSRERGTLELPLGSSVFDHDVARLSDDGLKAWQEVVDRGYEGLVAKDPASPYVGGRSLKWLKVKQSRYREGERGWEPKGKR